MAQHAHDATKHEPPNTVEFDGVRDGRLTTVKPRGRTGPHPAASTSTGVSQCDPNMLMMTAMMPLLTSLVERQTSAAPQAAVAQAAVIRGPVSGIPTIDEELHMCLLDFSNFRGINLMSIEGKLRDVELTPDIIPATPALRLCELTGATEGSIRKLQVFCKEWNVKLLEKRQSML